MTFRTFNTRASGSDSPCKVPRFCKASGRHLDAVRKPFAIRDGAKSPFAFLRADRPRPGSFDQARVIAPNLNP